VRSGLEIAGSNTRCCRRFFFAVLKQISINQVRHITLSSSSMHESVPKRILKGAHEI